MRGSTRCRAIEPIQTQLKVLATYKGKAGGEEIGFRHYGEATSGLRNPGYMPQTYRFERGRTYILFAAATDKAGVFRQLWKNHGSQEDQGLVLAAGTEPRTGEPIKRVVFAELTGHLKSDVGGGREVRPRAARPAQRRRYGGQKDFDREEVLDHVKRLLTHKDNEIVVAAVEP